MKFPVLTAVLFAVAASASSATALPAVNYGATFQPAETAALVQQVRYDRPHTANHKPNHKPQAHKKGHHRDDWRKDKRYSKYNKWNRYSKRPNRWRERSCIAVGPFWFCP